MEYFEEAAEMFTLTKFHTTDTQKLKVKIGDILSMKFKNHESLKKAFNVYEEIANEYINNNLMRFHAKKFFFNNILILLLLEDEPGAE